MDKLIIYMKGLNLESLKNNELITSEIKDNYNIEQFREFMRNIDYEKLPENIKDYYLYNMYKFQEVIPDIYHNFLSKNDTKKLFNDVYKFKRWGDLGGRSGSGSTMLLTMRTRLIIELIINKYNINSIRDVSCGSMMWLPTVLEKFKYIKFVGSDASEFIINQNKENFKDKENWSFYVADFSKDAIDKHDLIICRDTLQHNSYDNIFNFFKNIKKSGSKYLLTTNYNDSVQNEDIKNTGYFGINLYKEPFNIPSDAIVDIFDEETRYITQKQGNKYLFLIEIEKLPH